MYMNGVQASFMYMYGLSLKTAAVQKDTLTAISKFNHPSADLLFFSKEEKNRIFFIFCWPISVERPNHACLDT
jgi:hypothetical protein